MAIQKLRGVCPLEGCGWDGQLTVNGRMRTHRPPKDFTGVVGPSGNCGGGSDLPKPGSVYDADTKEPVQELSAAEAMEQRVAQGPGPGPNPLRSPVAPGSTGPGEPRDADPTHPYNDDHGGIWIHPGDLQDCTMPECSPVAAAMLEPTVEEAPRNLHAEVISALKNRTPEQKLATAARMDRTAAESTGLPLDLTLQIQAQLAGVLTNADRAWILDGWGYDMTCEKCDTHTHTCPGCGTQTRHNARVCKNCDAFYYDDPVQTPMPTNEELETLAAGVTAAPHVHRFEYGDDNRGHSGSFCTCGLEEPVQAAPEKLEALLERSSCVYPNGCVYPGEGCMGPCVDRDRPDMGLMQTAPADARPISGSEAERFLGRVTGSSSGSELEDFLAGGEAQPDAADFGRAPRWFPSKYDGECDMPGCGAYWDAGEMIRSDQRGGWQGYECCGWREDAPTPEEVAAAQALLDGTDLTPAESVDAEALLASAEEFARRAETARPRSGRPKTPMSNGRYVMPHPDKPGKAFRGTRVTNFENLPADKLQLKEWELRCVVLGMTERPELAASAKGLHVKADRKRLNALADEAKSAAGAKEKAGLGTRLHRYAEELDTGQRQLADFPEEFRADIAAYAQRCREDGYRMLPHLVERTTAVVPLSVMGTWDRVGLCPDGRYRIVDVKTGSLEYSQAEMCIQLKTYQLGANSVGYAEYSGQGDIQDWKNWVWKPLADEMGRPITVEDDYGLIFHLPPGDAHCTVYTAPFSVGAVGVKLADEIRTWQRQKQVFGTPDWSAPDSVPVPPVPVVPDRSAVTAWREELYQKGLQEAREMVAGADARAAQQTEELVITPEATETAMATLRDAGVLPAVVESSVSNWPDTTKEDDVPKVIDWEAKWSSVSSRQEAAALYEEMRPHLQEIGQNRFNTLVKLGQDALRDRAQKTPA